MFKKSDKKTKKSKIQKNYTVVQNPFYDAMNTLEVTAELKPQIILAAPTQFGFFRPINEFPVKQCKLNPEIVRNLAIAMYTNSLKYIIDKFLDFNKQEKEQFFHLFIIYNQLDDTLLDQFDCSSLKNSKLCGFPLYIAEQLKEKNLKYKELYDFFVNQLDIKLNSYHQIGNTKFWRPEYFISATDLITNKQDQNYELRLF